MLKSVIYPHPPKSKIELAEKLVRMITENNVELIAIGNGTASRETEQFVANVIKISTKCSIYYRK